MSVVAFRSDPYTDAFREDFAANRVRLPGAGLPWLDARRAKAMEAFGKTGIPNRRVEAWKYTDLSSALEAGLEPLPPVRDAVAGASPFAGIAGARVVLANGYVHRIEDAGVGLDIVDLGTLGVSAPDWIADALGVLASGVDQPLGAAALALMRGGVAVRVKTGHRILHLDFVNPPRGRDWSVHTRALIVVEEGASLFLLESHSGEGTDRSLVNIGAELVLKRGARIEHIRVQQETDAALHVASIGGSVARDAAYRALYVSLGAKLSRVDVSLRLADEGANATLHSVAVPMDRLSDITTVMDHASPHTTSRQLFKSVVGGRGRSVAQGRVTVREGAVKSDSHQLFKAILLSPRAEADAKPELEIFADDVVCGHGTAIGALEPDALFYLRARGIPEAEARGLLIRAFLEEAMQDFADETVHTALWARLDAALASVGSAA